MTRVLVAFAIGALSLGGAGAAVAGLLIGGGELGAWLWPGSQQAVMAGEYLGVMAGLGGVAGVFLYLACGQLGAGR